MTTKLSISIVDASLVAWAEERAQERATSVSAVIADALRRERQQEARRKLIDWFGGAGELTPALEAELRAEIEGPSAARPRRRARKPRK